MRVGLVALASAAMLMVGCGNAPSESQTVSQTGSAVSSNPGVQRAQGHLVKQG